MYKHILIATDGSELADKGVEHGLALAKPLGAKVTVLTVTEPLSATAVQAAVQGGMDNPLGLYEHQMDEEVRKLSDPIMKKAAELGVTVEVERETDEFPAEAIIRTAKRKGCDLIVMSSHGRRGVSKFLLGSQTSEVLVHTTIPVHVIR
ncbi:MAG: universal stress protein [Proteobacteria bacterium]|nr:MAG: universal stress protein [Pseudomonadota bacterium]